MNEPETSTTTLADLAKQQTTEKQREFMDSLALTELQMDILGVLLPREGCPLHSFTTTDLAEEVSLVRSQRLGDADEAVYAVSGKKVYEEMDKLRRKGLVEGAYAANRQRVWSLVEVPSVA